MSLWCLQPILGASHPRLLQFKGQPFSSSMENIHIFDEHHEVVPSLGLILEANSAISPVDNTIFHFDSHSDVGDIKTPKPLDHKFMPDSSLLQYLNVGNPFTLLFYYNLINDFYWFAPGERCHDVCQPFVFTVEHEWSDPLHFYRRQLSPCVETVFEARRLSLPTYRKLSIDSDENLEFLFNAFGYAMIDTGLREVTRGERGFILDICYDYFCSNPDHIASPMAISITEEYYKGFISDPLHPLKLRLGPLARVTRDETGFKLDIGGFETKEMSADFSDNLEEIGTIDRRLSYLERFLRVLRLPPQSIYMCRSGISNYTPKRYINYIENRLLNLFYKLDLVH